MSESNVSAQNQEAESATITRWGITEAEAKRIHNTHEWWCVFFFAMMLSFFRQWLLIAFYPFVVFNYILLYKFWRLIPVKEAETTPGRAVGFLFVPIFQVYWYFIAYYKLAKHYDEFDGKKKVKTSTISLCSCVLLLLGLFFRFIPVTEVFVLGFVLGVTGFIIRFWLMCRIKNYAVNLPRIE